MKMSTGEMKALYDECMLCPAQEKAVSSVIIALDRTRDALDLSAPYTNFSGPRLIEDASHYLEQELHRVIIAQMGTDLKYNMHLQGSTEYTVSDVMLLHPIVPSAYLLSEILKKCTRGIPDIIRALGRLDHEYEHLIIGDEIVTLIEDDVPMEWMKHQIDLRRKLSID